MVLHTKTGAVMNMVLKDKIVNALSQVENDGATQKEIAKLVQVCVRTLQNYLTPEVWEEVHQRRLAVINKSLSLVDKAVFEKAVGGDMTAARILYSRWDDLKKQQAFIEAKEEDDADLEEIERLEKQIMELERAEGE